MLTAITLPLRGLFLTKEQQQLATARASKDWAKAISC